MFQDKNEPRPSVDMWRDVGIVYKLKDNLEKSNLREEELISYCCSYNERERGEEEINSSFFPLSAEFRRSEFVEQRAKVHLLDEGYVWILKTRDFTEDSVWEFGKSKVSGLGSVHGTS